MTTLDDIPADKTEIMTAEFARLFRAAGCDPMCHCCNELILEKQTFMLASLDGEDEMLCFRCDVEKLRRKRERDEKVKRERQAYWEAVGTGGYSRPTRKVDRA